MLKISKWYPSQTIISISLPFPLFFLWSKRSLKNSYYQRVYQAFQNSIVHSGHSKNNSIDKDVKVCLTEEQYQGKSVLLNNMVGPINKHPIYFQQEVYQSMSYRRTITGKTIMGFLNFLEKMNFQLADFPPPLVHLE